ncbi:MAG: flagellar FlbD family protein [Deltaproteobacteria bacterium]|nr:flagellar FlbD family protein [Deltaproteobacteria bacterium]
MLRLRRLNNTPLVVNLQSIALVEQTPDTLLVLTNGDRIHVAESVEEVVEQAVAFLTKVQAGALTLVQRQDDTE